MKKGERDALLYVCMCVRELCKSFDPCTTELGMIGFGAVRA
jgi:hypothetical protein